LGDPNLTNIVCMLPTKCASCCSLLLWGLLMCICVLGQIHLVCLSTYSNTWLLFFLV
jgi:hypothetical protein